MARLAPSVWLRDPDAWLRAAAWVVILGSALQIALFSFGRDQGIYAVVADGLLQGKMPYRDVWDFKPPGIYLIYALAQALFGKSMMAPRLLEVMALIGSVLLMRRLSQRFFQSPTPGLLAGALSALVQAQLDFWHTGQPETYGGFFTVLGITLTLEDPEPRGWRVPLGVGLAFGVASVLKPTLGGGALVAAAFLALSERGRGRALLDCLRPVGWVALGGALPTLGCLLWFWAGGAIRDVYWTLGEFVPGYTALTWEGRRASALLYFATLTVFFKFSALAAAGVIAAIALSAIDSTERRILMLLFGVIGFHILGIAMQGKFFPYHYAATLPVVAMVAGIGLHKLFRRCQVGGLPGVVAFFAFTAILVPMRYAVRDLPQLFWTRAQMRLEYLLGMSPYDSRAELDVVLGHVADYSLSADRRVADAIQKATPERATLFVWGFEPVIYWLSDRAPASRFIYNVAQRSEWEQERARKALLADLARTRPAVFVVQRRDIFPAVTGSMRDSVGELDQFPELQLMLESQYDLRRRIEDFEIYALDSGLEPTPPPGALLPETPL